MALCRLTRCLSGLFLAGFTLGPLTACESSPFAGDDDTPLLVELTRNLAGPTPAQAGRDGFDRQDADKRRRAIALISSADWGGESEYLAVYRLILSDPDPTVRAACVAALGRHGQPDDAILIAPQLGADEADLRWETAKALRKLHHGVVVPRLIQTLQSDDDPDTRMAAAEALGQYRRRDVFDALVGALTSPDFGTAHAARRSLTLLTGADAGPEPADWQQLANAKTRTNGDALFADAQPYTYREYVKPPGFLDKAQFWRDPEAEATKRPIGMESES